MINLVQTGHVTRTGHASRYWPANGPANGLDDKSFDSLNGSNGG
jgi:hypothetical protein